MAKPRSLPYQREDGCPVDRLREERRCIVCLTKEGKSTKVLDQPAHTTNGRQRPGSTSAQHKRKLNKRWLVSSQQKENKRRDFKMSYQKLWLRHLYTMESNKYNKKKIKKRDFRVSYQKLWLPSSSLYNEKYQVGTRVAR